MLPPSFISSLKGLPGFNEQAFVETHELKESITSIRINTNKSFLEQPSSFFKEASPIAWCEGGYYLKERPLFVLDPLWHAGAYYVQEASSMFLHTIIRQLADPEKYYKVLDLCAAPGGKTTLLANYFKNGLVVANETIKSRNAILEENCIRWGSDHIVVTQNDPSHFKALPNFFDFIVADAPCSGRGMFRKDPQAIKEWSEENVLHCSQRQTRIIEESITALQEGGYYIYSTCSYSSEEDEEVLDWVMKEFKVESLKLKAEEEWNIDEVETNSGAYGYRFWPYKVKGEGFFIAAFKKKESADQLRIKIKTTQLASKQEAMIAANWLKNTEGLSFIKQGQNIAAIPTQLNETIQYLMQELKVRYAGVELGTIAKNDLLPEHALAVSTILKDDVFKVELTLAQALDYLRKNEINIDSPHKGWALAVYNNFPLGEYSFQIP